MTAVSKPSAAVIDRLLPIIAERVSILHGAPLEDDGGSPGGDIDCALLGLDPAWPLRLDQGWRVCQRLHYDLTGWYWILERDGEVLAIDGLEDPHGIGRYGFPTAAAIGGPGDSCPPAVRASYLTAKRVWKRIDDPLEWQRIARNGREDVPAFEATLRGVFGRSLGLAVARQALEGQPPYRALRERARRRQQLRRVRSPRRLAVVTIAHVLRMLERVVQPTGLIMVVSGPDGVGKSTLAGALPDACQGPFRRHLHRHWRPWLLPSPAAVLRREGGDTSRPQARPPHGRALSCILLGYYWLDFLVGNWFLLWPTRARSGLVILERGWYDLAVDPLRYRLRVPARLVSMLGRLLPRPDLVLLLQADSGLLLQRKLELPAAELDRQAQRWREVLPATRPHVVLDASRPAPDVVASAREAVMDLLEERTTARLGLGWTALPTRRVPRWWLPRGPGGTTAAAALGIYQPVTKVSRAGWEAARLTARLGGLRLTRRGCPPPRAIRQLLARHVGWGEAMAVMRANHPGRFIALILDATGQPAMVAKIALDPGGRDALAREVKAIHAIGGHLPPPLTAPVVLESEPGLLLTKAIPWRPRKRPWELPMEVAVALGAFYRADRAIHGDKGMAHGDCAPWNLLDTGDEWALVDWEEAHKEAPPFFDVLHYLVQSHALLKRPTRRAIVQGAAGRGWIGQRLHAYAEAAEVDPGSAPDHLVAYLRASASSLDRGSVDGRTGLLARRRLLACLSPTMASDHPTTSGD